MLSVVSFSCSDGLGFRLFYFVLSCSAGLAAAIMRTGYLRYLRPPVVYRFPSILWWWESCALTRHLG